MDNEQPAKAILAARGMTIAGVARIIELKYNHVQLSLLGKIPPCPELRTRLAEFLGLPIEELFQPDLLAQTYTGPGPDLRGGDRTDPRYRKKAEAFTQMKPYVSEEIR